MTDILQSIETEVIERVDRVIELVSVGIQGPPGPSGIEVWEPEAAEAIAAGRVAACNSAGQAILADATLGSREALGVSRSTVAIGFGAEIRLDGLVTLASWASATGSASLTPGANYWLTTNGQMSTTPPSAAGARLQRVGRAISTDTLAIEIEYHGRRAAV